MKALYVGGPDFFRQELVPLLEQAGYQVDCGKPDFSQQYDLVVDYCSTSAIELRTVVAAIGSAAHYVLISSHHVYPASFRLRPWREDEINVTFDLFQSLAVSVRTARAKERELRLLARSRFPFTILRPAHVDGLDVPDGLTQWFVQRISNGGLIVLPEGDLPTYRHVAVADLASAVAAVAGRIEAHDVVLNVASQAILSYRGHAAMVRDGLSKPLKYGYVPVSQWRAAGLSLPAGEMPSSSFIEPSPLLRELGWRPSDTQDFVKTLSSLIDKSHRVIDTALIRKERNVLKEAETVQFCVPGAPVAGELSPSPNRQWVLLGWPGQPASLTLDHIEMTKDSAVPLVRVRALTLTASDERLLRGEYPQSGQRIIGHNALLEVMQSGTSGLDVGAMTIPLSTLPCDDRDCTYCLKRGRAVLGIARDGYGQGAFATSPSHLVPVSAALGMNALLIDPLACLLAALSVSLAKDSGTVWIAGRTFEAALVAWMAQDAGRPVVHVDRRVWNHPEFPVEAIGEALKEIRAGKRKKPTLAVDFTGSSDVTWPLTNALAVGSSIYVRRRPPGIAPGIHWHEIPAAAPTRAALGESMAIIQRWTACRNIGARIGPAIPLDSYWDALLPSPFSLPWLEART